MFSVDITPKKFEISLRSSSMSRESQSYIALVDTYDNTTKFLYLDNGVLYVSSTNPF